MPDASNRTDLFRALNNFMAVLAAYAPGNHREDVVLEVGDTAFRAFERALAERNERRLPAPLPPGPVCIEWYSEAGRVVIRTRAAQHAVTPSPAVYGDSMAKPYMDLPLPGYDPRTPEQKFEAHNASIRRETVADIVKDLEEWLPEHRDISAALYVNLLNRIRRHAEKQVTP